MLNVRQIIRICLKYQKISGVKQKKIKQEEPQSEQQLIEMTRRMCGLTGDGETAFNATPYGQIAPPGPPHSQSHTPNPARSPEPTVPPSENRPLPTYYAPIGTGWNPTGGYGQYPGAILHSPYSHGVVDHQGASFRGQTATGARFRDEEEDEYDSDESIELDDD